MPWLCSILRTILKFECTLLLRMQSALINIYRWVANIDKNQWKFSSFGWKSDLNPMHGKTENVILIRKKSKLLRFPSCLRVLWQRVCACLPFYTLLLWAFKNHCDDTFHHWVCIPYSRYRTSIRMHMHMEWCYMPYITYVDCEAKRSACNLDCGQFGMQYRFLFCTSFAFVTIAISFAF